jgi:hypothetical protein
VSNVTRQNVKIQIYLKVYFKQVTSFVKSFFAAYYFIYKPLNFKLLLEIEKKAMALYERNTNSEKEIITLNNASQEILLYITEYAEFVDSLKSLIMVSKSFYRVVRYFIYKKFKLTETKNISNDGTIYELKDGTFLFHSILN